MREVGWKVISVDWDENLNPDIVEDVNEFHYKGKKPDLLWMSPTCTEFAREFMPWCSTGLDPDLTLLLSCIRLVKEIKPKYWVLENVKGAIKWFKPFLGNYRLCVSPFYFWGFFPDIGKVNKKGWINKSSLSSNNDKLRGSIPYTLSRAFGKAVEFNINPLPLKNLGVPASLR